MNVGLGGFSTSSPSATSGGGQSSNSPVSSLSNFGIPTCLGNISAGSLSILSFYTPAVVPSVFTHIELGIYGQEGRKLVGTGRRSLVARLCVCTTSTNFPILIPSTITIEHFNKQYHNMATMADQTSQPTCQNCQTSTTPLWRRDEIGSVLCNACGLFLKLHGRPRPISLKTDVIKSRNRVKSSGTGPQGAKKKVRLLAGTALSLRKFAVGTVIDY